MQSITDSQGCIFCNPAVARLMEQFFVSTQFSEKFFLKTSNSKDPKNLFPKIENFSRNVKFYVMSHSVIEQQNSFSSQPYLGRAFPFTSFYGPIVNLCYSFIFSNSSLCLLFLTFNQSNIPTLVKNSISCLLRYFWS